MADQDYYPLKAGLAREYRRLSPEGNARYSFEIVSVRVEGQTVTARCKTAWLRPDGTTEPGDEFEACRRPGGIFIGGALEIPLPPVVGARWTVAPDIHEVTALDAAAEVPAGRFAGCLRVSYLIGGGDSGSGEILYAPSVGPVLEERRDEARPYRLELVRFRAPPGS